MPQFPRHPPHNAFRGMEDRILQQFNDSKVKPALSSSPRLLPPPGPRPLSALPPPSSPDPLASPASAYLESEAAPATPPLPLQISGTVSDLKPEVFRTVAKTTHPQSRKESPPTPSPVTELHAALRTSVLSTYSVGLGVWMQLPRSPG